jgi:hypothetical protein
MEDEMNTEKWIFWSLPAFGFLLNACLRDVGECYVPNDDGQGGAGGSIVPGGAGGYGDVPRRPLDASGFGGDPCSTQTIECVVTWKPGSDVCKQQGTASSCTSLYQGSHASLTEAKEQCEKTNAVGTEKGAQSCGPCTAVPRAADEKCKQACERAYDKCMDKCKDDSWRNQCFSEFVECLRECDK